MAKTMVSKYPGTCADCKTRFETGTVILWASGHGARHADPKTCQTARLAAEQAKAARVEASKVPSTLTLKPIADFLLAARERGLKFPAVRFLAPGGGELRLHVAGDQSKAPGSIQVKIDNQWIGRVEPDGRIYGYVLANRADVQAALTAIAADPAAAAKAYGAVTGACSFCSRKLTDAGSVEVGYGAVCAGKYNLPHKHKGTPMMAEVA